MQRFDASVAPTHRFLFFFPSRRSKYDMLMENVSNLLQQLPGQFATLVTVSPGDCFVMLLPRLSSARGLRRASPPLASSSSSFVCSLDSRISADIRKVTKYTFDISMSNNSFYINMQV